MPITTTKRRSSKGHPIPQFLHQLLLMLQNESSDAIQWDNGRIVVPNRERLCGVLGRYFKHNNFLSFHRQMNYFGFKKAKDEIGMVYIHPNIPPNAEMQTLLVLRRSTFKSKEPYYDAVNIEQMAQKNNMMISQNEMNSNTYDPCLSPAYNIFPHNDIENKNINMNSTMEFNFYDTKPRDNRLMQSLTPTESESYENESDNKLQFNMDTLYFDWTKDFTELEQTHNFQDLIGQFNYDENFNFFDSPIISRMDDLNGK